MKKNVVRGLTALALAALTLASPAQAAPTNGPGTLYAQADSLVYESGCVASSTQTRNQKPVQASGEEVVGSVAATTTLAKAGGPTSTIDLKASGTARITGAGDRFSSFDLAAQGRAAISSPVGQTCTSAGRVGLEQYFTFTLTRPVWLTASTSTGSQTGAWIQIRRYDQEGQQFSFESEESGGTSSATWYLPAGNYSVNAAVNWYHFVAPGSASGARSGKGNVHVEVRDAGGAYGATSGSGKKYVALGNQVACSTNALAARFGKRVKSAKFYVDGRKVRTVSKPKAGSTTTIPGVARTKASKVRVQLVVDPPGRRTKQTVTATRTYRACTAAQ